MKADALKLYDFGFMPIPLRNDAGHRKQPAILWRAFQNERPERAVVEGLFDGDFNVAVITGRVSGIVVVDLDGQVPDPKEWLSNRGFNVNTPIVSTGRGGAHVYYRHPGGTVPNGVKLRELDGVTIDIRGDGGYVVAPPSMHDTGALYEWVVSPAEFEPAMFPPELMAMLNRATEFGTADGLKASDFSGNEVEDILKPAEQGNRNHAAARAAGFWLKTTHDDESAAWAALNLWNYQNHPPLPTRELRQTFESIWRRRQTQQATIETESESGGGDPLPLMDGAAWADAIRDMPPRHGVPSFAVPTLDNLGGLVPRDLIVLAGRPGMGKSTCAWNLVAEVSLRGPKLPTVIFSTEMTANDVARWMGGRLFKKDGGSLTRDEWLTTLRMIAASPITICDAGAVTADQIDKIVRSRPETRLVIVDHIQRLRSRGGSAGENKNHDVGYSAVTLKSLAKDVGCTVLALSQMNRASDLLGRPKLSSIRDSGEVEQEADAVIFLWSAADDLTTNPLEVEFYMAKNRHGKMEQLKCMFHKVEKRFQPIGLQNEFESVRQDERNIEAVKAMATGAA